MILKPIKQLLSNIEIRLDETATYSAIVVLASTLATIIHWEGAKLYLTVAGGIVGTLHLLFPNNLKFRAMDEAIEQDKEKELV